MVFQTQFWVATREPGESLDHYAARLGRIFRQAFPGDPEHLLMHRFISGLDHDLKLKVLTGEPATLQAAVSKAKQHEAWTSLIEKDKQEQPGVNQVTSKEPDEAATQRKELESRILQLEDTLRSYTPPQSTPQNSANSRFNQAPRNSQNDPNCWECGKPGHFARECWRKRRPTKPLPYRPLN